MAPLLRSMKRSGALGVIAALLAVGCVKKDYPGDAPVIAGVDLEGADAVDRDDVLAFARRTLCQGTLVLRHTPAFS